MSATTLGDRLNTTDAGKLIGRSQTAVRSAIRDGVLKAENVEGRWYIDRQVLLAWHKKARVLARHTPPPWEATAELIATYGSASTEELTELSGLHIGNVRKYLAILAKQGRVQRSPDGQWLLIGQTHEGAA